MTGSLIFYGTCLFGNLFFIKIAIEWPNLIQLWRRNEDVFLKVPYIKWKRSLAFDIRIITISIMVMSLRKYLVNVVECKCAQ